MHCQEAAAMQLVDLTTMPKDGLDFVTVLVSAGSRIVNTAEVHGHDGDCA